MARSIAPRARIHGLQHFAQSLARLSVLHESLANQKGVKSSQTKTLQIFTRMQSGFAHSDGIFRNFRNQVE